MTKKLVYMKLKNVTEKELQDMMSSEFNKLTQRGLDRELEHITGVSHRTWGNYKLNTPLKKTILKDLDIFEMKKLLLKVVNSPQKLDDEPHVRVSLNLIEDIEHFLSRDEKL